MIKRLISISLIHFIALCATGQITFIDYGEDFIVPAGASQELDIDCDGDPDFIFNTVPGTDLNMWAISMFGCITIDFPMEMNPLGGWDFYHMIQGDTVMGGTGYYGVYKFGESSGSPFGIYDQGSGLANGWEHGTDQYLGLMLFSTFSAGWMKVRVDTIAKEFQIKQIAYELTPHVPVIVGDTGIYLTPPCNTYWDPDNVTSTISESKSGFATSFEQWDRTTSFTIYPNPTSGILNIEPVSEQILVFNAQGQLVIESVGSFVDLTDQPPGIYSVRSLSSGVALETKFIVQ